MAITHGKMTLSFWDHDGEACSIGVPTAAVDGAGLDAQDALLDSAKTALRALMVAPAEIKDARAYNIDFTNPIKSANPHCQREAQFLIFGRDTLTLTIKKISVPCANLTLLSTNEPTVDLTAGEGLAVKAALDAVWRSTETGNLISVFEIRHVGRTL